MPNTMAMFTRILGTVGTSTITAVGIPLINPNRTGRAQKIISNAKEANLISSDHLNRNHRKQAARIALLKAALIVPVAATTELAVALAVEVVPAIWIARLRIDRVAIFQVNGSKISNAVTAAASGVTVLVVEAVIASAVAVALVASTVVAAGDLEDLEVAASAVSVEAAGSGGADEDNAWNSPILFLEKLKTH